MGVIKGQNLRMTLGGKYVAFATDCTVHVSMSLEDSSSKDSTDGIWQEQEIVGAAWDISASALYSVDEDATGINAEDALDMVLAMQKVKVEFTGTSGDKNRTASGTKYSGYVWLNDHSITATNRQNGTYSLQAQGTGPLKKGDIDASPSSDQNETDPEEMETA